MTSNPPNSTTNPTLDNDTLRERILIGGGGIGLTRGSLTKVATRYRDFVEAVWTCARLSREANRVATSPDTPNEQNEIESLQLAMEQSRNHTENLSAALTREILLYDLEIRKLALSSRASDGNSSQYAATLSQMQQTVSQTQREIVSLTSTLERERQVKKYREEYNALAKIGNEKHPPMRKTREELERVEREIERVKGEVKEARWELGVRERQMRVLMQSVMDLKATLREEDLKSDSKSGIDAGAVASGEVGASLSPSPVKGKKRKRLDEGSDSNDDDIGAL